MSREDNIKEFEKLMSTVSRGGIESLMGFIRKSDFYSAPASTRYHNSFEGGLLEHSLNVYRALDSKYKNNPVWKEKLSNIEEESIIVVSLLHDLCKTYFYTVEMRNQKVDGQWVQVPYYAVNDRIPYGHGEKSVMMVEEYMKLKPVERFAIRWHMGPYNDKDSLSTLSQAMEKYPLVLALFEADMEASYLSEDRK